MSKPVTIIMIEDDEGHARLIERNIRRSASITTIVPFTQRTAAVNYLFGSDGSGVDHKGNALLILLDLNLPDMTGTDTCGGQGEQISEMRPPSWCSPRPIFARNQALLMNSAATSTSPSR